MKQEDVINFLRGQTKLLEEGNFDELYTIYRRKVNPVSTPLTELLVDAGIEPLDYLPYIPDKYAQGGKLITEVVIPENIKGIGRSAFEDCTGLTSVTIPDSVTSIGSYAFSGCNNLTGITIPNSVTSIGSEAFSGCSKFKSVNIPDSVTIISWGAFRNCTGLTSVTIGDGVTSIGGYAFSYCMGLTSVTIPNSVVEIGKYAFNDIADIKYEGTKEEWYKIRKRMYWNGDVKKYTVHCSDGDVKGARG